MQKNYVKVIKIILITSLIILMFGCMEEERRDSKETSSNNTEIIEEVNFISYTETESYFDGEWSESDNKSNIFKEKNEESDYNLLVESYDKSNNLRRVIYKEKEEVEIFDSNYRTMSRMSMNDLRRNDSDFNEYESKLINTIYSSMKNITYKVRRKIIKRDLSEYISDIIDEEKYILKDEGENYWIEVIYDYSIKRVKLIKIIEKNENNKYEELIQEFAYEKINGRLVPIAEVTKFDTRDNFNYSPRTEEEILEETAFLLGLDKNEIEVVCDEETRRSSVNDSEKIERKVPYTTSKSTSSIVLKKYSDIQFEEENVRRKFTNIRRFR